MTDHSKIIQDISLLYELSLSVGSSLDIAENCKVFLNTLVSRKGLAYAAVWLKKGEQFHKICGVPQFRMQKISIDTQHIVPTLLAKKNYHSFHGDHPNFAPLIQEQDADRGTYAFFALGDIGFLKLLALNRKEAFSNLEMAQLKSVIDKFTISLNGCLAHKQLIKETQEREEAEKALKKSSARLKDVFDNMYDALLILDEDANIKEANKAARELLGYGEDEALNLNAKNIVHPEDKENSARHFKQLVEQGFYSDYEGRIFKKNGEIVHIEVNANAIYEDGKFKGSRDLIRDITQRKLAEEESLKAEIRLTNLVTNLQAGILLEDETRHILLANQCFCDIFDIPVAPQQIIGQDCSQGAEQSKHLFMEPEHFIKGVDQLLQARKRKVNEELVMADGRVMERDYIPLFSGQTYLGHLWQYRDITQQRNAQLAIKESEEKYRGIIENMELGLLEVGLDQTIIKPYPIFCDMLGYTEEEMIGKNAEELLLPQKFRPVLQKQEIQRLDGKTGVYEIQIKKKDGSRIWVLISGAPIVDPEGNITGSIGIHYDITDRKLLEQDLSLAKDRAEKAQKAERQFLANMSHEIRTPMNAVIGMTHLLYETKPNELQKEYLDSLRFSADSLMAIISNILDLSKIGAGEVEFESKPFDLVQLIHALQRTFQFKVREKPISTVIDIDPAIQNLVIGDSTRLNQIFTNLLGNASKFTQRGTIGIKVTLLKQQLDDYLIEFRVHDTGIGIAKEKQETIFQNFKQADLKITRNFGGTGLGLTIVKELVELQNGSIKLESELGKGSVFIFTLPFKNTGRANTNLALEPEESQTDIDAVLKGLQVLLVEDNVMNQKLASRILSKWGAQYIIASDGEIAVKASKEKKYDLILMDIHMPNMDGCEATTLIRSEVSNPNQGTPIIALTAAALLEEKTRALEAGMNDFITKPFSPRILKEQVLKTLGFKRALITKKKPTAAQAIHVDLKYLNEFSSGDIYFIRDMLETFIREAPITFGRIKNAMEEQNWEEVYKGIHKIKPSFMMLGMQNQYTAAAALESLVRKDEFEISAVENTIIQLANDTQLATPILEDKLRQIIQVAEG